MIQTNREELSPWGLGSRVVTRKALEPVKGLNPGTLLGVRDERDQDLSSINVLIQYTSSTNLDGVYSRPISSGFTPNDESSDRVKHFD